jgi:hypothetical protein
MKITRDLAIQILKYLDEHPSFYFPFQVMNKEYSDEDEDFVEVEPNEWKMIADEEKYQTFELWENLQNLHEETLQLMVKGFIEKITGQSVEKSISRLVKNLKRYWKEDMWLTHKTVDYGLNELIGGKIEAFEDCLRIIKDFNN